MSDDSGVRKSFAEQAEWCLKLGSPFTALLCQTLAGHLDDDTAIGRDILAWSGDPRAAADALPLFRRYLAVAPQTNEVGRSGVLIAGFLEFARRFAARVAACGAAATAARPFGWLRFELDVTDGPAALTLSSRPGGETRRLARAHPHGRTVTYLP